MSDEYKHWCGNCQIRIYIQRHEGRILTWQDCPYTCEYATAMRCSTRSEGESVMTNAEAIETLRANYPDACYEQLREAVDVAIEALNAQGAAGDTISRQAAIDGFWQLDANFKIRPSVIDAITITKMLKNLPSAQRTGRWTPCSKGLPDEETDVFICNANGDREISRGSYSTEMKGDFIWYTSGWRFGKVVAWMPLPESYKEEQE